MRTDHKDIKKSYTTTNNKKLYKPVTSVLNSFPKLEKVFPSSSTEKSSNHATNDGKNAIPLRKKETKVEQETTK